MVCDTELHGGNTEITEEQYEKLRRSPARDSSHTAFSPLPCAFLSVFHIPISDTESHRENTEITEKQ